jgi:hypothetical protein
MLRFYKRAKIKTKARKKGLNLCTTLQQNFFLTKIFVGEDKETFAKDQRIFTSKFDKSENSQKLAFSRH